MATASPLASAIDDAPSGRRVIDPIAAELARRNPGVAARIGVSVDELAQFAADSVSLEQAEQLGWIDAAERRLYQGQATLEDLRAMGYGDNEARAMLDEQQQDRACASST
jgi:hypothetical protein